MVKGLSQYSACRNIVRESSDGYYLGITTNRNYQLLELPIRLVGIPNWLEILIRIARNYQHSKLPIFGIFNRNTECEPGYGLRYGLGCILGYCLGYGLGNGLGCGLWHQLGCGLRYGLGYGLGYELEYG